MAANGGLVEHCLSLVLHFLLEEGKKKAEGKKNYLANQETAVRCAQTAQSRYPSPGFRCGEFGAAS